MHARIEGSATYDPVRWIVDRVEDAVTAEAVIWSGRAKFIEGIQIAWKSGKGDSGGAWAEKQGIVYMLEQREDLNEIVLETMNKPSRMHANRWVNVTLGAVNNLRNNALNRWRREVREALSY